MNSCTQRSLRTFWYSAATHLPYAAPLMAVSPFVDYIMDMSLLTSGAHFATASPNFSRGFVLPGILSVVYMFLRMGTSFRCPNPWRLTSVGDVNSSGSSRLPENARVESSQRACLLRRYSTRSTDIILSWTRSVDCALLIHH